MDNSVLSLAAAARVRLAASVIEPSDRFLARQRCARSRRVLEHAHGVPVADESPDDRRSDEAGGAGDEDLHDSNSSSSGSASAPSDL